MFFLKSVIIHLAVIIRNIVGFRALLFYPAKLRSVNRVLARKGETVVLGGVYTSKTVRNWLATLGPSGKLVVIEANPKSVEKLRGEFEGEKNLILVSKAVWSGPGKITFTVSDTDYQGWARVKDDTVSDYPVELDKSAYEIEIDADSIDNIVADHGITQVDAVYLTINDSQLKAVDGLRKTMAANKDIRIIMHTRFPSPAMETVEKLQALGMKTSVKLLGTKLKRPDVKRLDTIYTCH